MNFLELSGTPLWGVIVLFAGASLGIVLAGTRMTRLADRLADVTGLGEALFGAVLLGGATSLGGIVTSLATAAQNYPELALSNAVGNIAAQTMILAIADVVYRGANLEHAAASIGNLMQGALLIVMLGIPLMAVGSPSMSLWGMHPLSFILIITYIFGLHVVRSAQDVPRWKPKETRQTEMDEPDEKQRGGSTLWGLWAGFAVLAIVVCIAGYLIAESAIALADRTGLSATVVGGFLTAIVTASPELVTSIAAVRQGALTLAVGGIIGGNTFDIMVVSLADAAYREGSIYHAVGEHQIFLIALTLVLNGLLLLGLIRRQPEGIGNIGFESALMLLAYFAGSILLFVAM